MKRTNPLAAYSSLLSEYGALIALVVLFLFNAITRRGEFLHLENIRNLVSQNASVGIIAVGMTLVIIAGGIDLSVGSLTAMCGAVAILVVNKLSSGGMGAGMVIVLATFAAVLVGAVAGLVNGAVVAYGRVASFIVTLAGLAGFRSIALVLGSGRGIRSQLSAFGDFGFAGIAIPFAKSSGGDPVLLYWSAIIFIAIALLGGFVLNRTRFGRYVIAVGANERASTYLRLTLRRSGLPCSPSWGPSSGSPRCSSPQE